MLVWATAAEPATKLFTLEFSTDSNTFKGLADMPATGNWRQYGYVHKNVLTDAFYRLKIVALDGSYTYSNVVKLNANSSDDCLVNNGVYPLPFTDKLHIVLSACKAQTVDCTIYTAEGTLIGRKSIPLQAGKNDFVLDDLGYLAAGTYVLHIQSGYNQVIVKAVKE